MKSSMAIAFLALALMPAGARAHDRTHSRSEIKLLKDSAAALEPTNPELADRLKECAAKGSLKKDAAEAAEDERSEKAEKSEAQLFRDSAAALRCFPVRTRRD